MHWQSIFLGASWSLIFGIVITKAQVQNTLPIFVENQYLVTYYEEQPIGSDVLQVSAVDNEGNNITYELGSDSQGLFQIDSNNGKITALAVLDRETMPNERLEFTVYAYDDVTPSFKASVSVSLTVLDVNDHHPQFVNTTYKAKIIENAGVGSPVTQVTATDQDKSRNKLVTFTIEKGNDGNKFAIGPYTGTVFVFNPLNYEAARNYTLEILAKDGGDNGGLNASTSLFIEVEDADDLPAQFSKPSYTAEVSENSVKGTSVVQVTAHDGDLSLNAPVTYLIDEASNPDGTFMILSNHGVITVNGSLDREAKTFYLLRVGAQSTVHNPVFTTVTITVTDVNDNPPVFINAPYMGIVQENSPQGVTVLQVTAQDADAGVNKAFGYTLVGAGGKFSVTELGYIVVSDSIDRETEDEYNFQVVAQETQTSERRQSTASVTINVTDVNDNNPQCSQAVYKTTIQENLPNDTFVLKVLASDADLSTNAHILFSLVPDSRDHHMLFSIDPISGDIYTTDTFDREKLELYTITVRATDQPISGQGRFGECSVQVTIGDENDNSPSFVNLPNDTTLSETSAISTSVYQIEAVDADEGVNAAVSYSLLSGNTGGAFTLDTNSGILKSAKTLDRETQAQYTLEVKATDGKGKVTTSYLTVHVTDVNDNAPVFTRPQGYVFSVDEAEVALTVGTVKAADVDEGRNAEIHYSLKSEGDFNKFDIDPVSGEIKTAVALDRESVDQLNIRVIAADQGTPAQTREVPVQIDVTDVNDHRPAFGQRHYAVMVLEQEPAHVLLNLTASDDDIGVNAAFHFSILSGNHGDIFSIDSGTGSLSTTGPLDREERGSYVLLVRVADLHGNHSYGQVFDDTAVVEVTVQDVNDHSPVFAQPLYSVNIYENITTGTQIVQVVAKDRDLGQNMKVQYSIVSGNELERFLIDAHSGQVYVQSPLDRDPPKDETSFLLKVMAKDKSNNSLNATTEVNVTVFDVNDSPPEFESASYTLNIPENTTTGADILQPQCTDRDSGSNGAISFRISAGNDEVPPKFSVDSVTGALSVSSGFDFDSGKQSYKLTLTATDKGDPPLMGNAEVTVKLENINDNAPEFTKVKYHFSVREGSYSKDPKIIGRVSATDADRDVYNSAIGQVVYSFVNQSSYYRDYQWLFNELQGGKFPDVRGGVDAEAKNGAQIILDPVLGEVASLSGAGEWIHAGDFKDDCVSDPALCTEGLTVAFFLNFTSGRYIISSGGQSEFATGFAFYYNKETSKFVMILATGTKKWTVEMNSIPEGWYYVTFTWSSQSGLRYFQDGRLIASAGDWTVVSRGSDIFTVLAIGKPNSIDSPDYFGKLGISDLMIWKIELTEDEVLHSYEISRHVTGNEMLSAPQYIGTFTITPETGEIDVFGVLDREKKANYSVDVQATDRDPVFPRHNSTVVIVEVLDVNDNAPVFEANSYAVDLEEHSSPEKMVLKVKATDSDEGTNSVLSYSIVSGNLEDVFQVDSVSGELTVAQDIDREHVHEYRLGVQAQDGGSPSLQTTVQVTVNIVDVNDNSPVITASSYVASVKENLPAGQSVLKLSVYDPDHGANGNVTFSLNSDKFKVNASTGVLHTTQTLDRELQAHYDITIRATDGGVSPKSGEVQVRVDVEDENDNEPQFSEPAYRVAILENTTRGATVLRVTAADPDDGSNGDIAYALQGGDGAFSINRTSGVITVISTVDREANPHGYSLIVTARDYGYPRAQISSAVLNVTVSDVNDNAPIFDKFTYSGMVAENSSVSTVVTSVHATDRDEGLAGQIVYSITGGNEDEVFAVDSVGRITVAKELDRESKSAYELTIEATDRAGDPKSASVEVDITVTDANDNPPIFGNIPASILISESALPNTPVFSVIATDQDLGINGDIYYSGHSPGGKFAIHRDTGVISTVGELDFEKVRRHIFYVVASDGGEPPLNSSTLRLNITVVDANDNNPKFTQASYSASVYENETVGHSVTKVNATERDSDQLSRIGYNISGGDLQKQFGVDYYSGEISVQKSLDREKLPVYTLLVTATDNGVPPRFGQTSVTIHVLDVNDHAPVFNFKDYQQEVSEDSGVGTTVLTVDAVDGDSPDVTQLVYSILDGNEGNHLAMKTVKTDGKYIGAVVVENPLDREQQAFYKLTISVSDGVFSSNASAEILLSDVNDRFPEFNNSGHYFAQITEDSPAGLHVLRVTATDRDLGANAKLAYSLTGADGKFIIDASSGDIRTSADPLDREFKSVYDITVVATDSGGKQGQTVVPIRVLDINDNKPLFNPPSLTVTFVEGPGTQGILVTKLNATDADEGENQMLTYAIVDGNLGNVFAIDNRTGEITTTKLLDREEPGLPVDDQERGVHTLIVKAADHGNPAQSTSTVVTIRVLDINDNPPVFPPNGYHVMISEGAKSNEDVVAAIALDKDAGNNKKLTYELISGNTEEDFMLDPNTAMIKTTKDLQRQQTFSYNLTIGASDHGKPSFSATTTVYIVVGDVNDNNPVYNPVNYSVSVYENVPWGTPLVNVTATDADSFQNAKITYSVTSGDTDSVYAMETKDAYGTLVVAGLVDREQKERYTLQITAEDGGVPISRKAQATVFVTVLDRNDNHPQFSQSEYRGTIVENAPPGRAVSLNTEIRATDADSGLHGDIRYYLNGSESHQFIIDTFTGQLRTRLFPSPTLDHEKTGNYTFYAVAVDERGVGQSTFVEVVVKVLDTNDNVPQFFPFSSEATINEDVSVGFSVARVTATDSDSDLNGRISYYIISGGVGKFEVGRFDGIVRVSESLDRETNPVHTLNISAVDGSYYPQEGYGVLTVVLEDVNDNAPKFAKQVFQVGVSEDVPVGEVFVNVTATDADFGTNADVTYSMSHSTFAIDSKTGGVRAVKSLDREKEDTYSFIVYAQDGGGLVSSVAVNVVVHDVNDNSPHFLTDVYKTDVLGKTPVGTVVLIVVAEDEDIGENGEMEYSIANMKDDLFSIGAQDGLVRVEKPINRLDLKQRGVIDAQGGFVFNVVARDKGQSPRSSNVSVVMNIVDPGDDSPAFNRSSYVVYFDENEPPGTSVLLVRVVQQRPGSELTFSIPSSQNQFTINNKTGLISTLVPLDRETREKHVFTVEATDNGQTPLRGYTSATVYVTDDNDNSPEFQFPTPYKMAVQEDAPLGTGVGQLVAFDKDDGTNAQFEYVITHANIGPGLKMISVNAKCDTPLGMESGDVRASDVSASSTLEIGQNEKYYPTLGRLNNRPFTQSGVHFKGAWCAAVNDQNQYIQVDFGGMRKVTKVSTQGRPGASDYVSSYYVLFSVDGNTFETHRTLLPGNSDGDTKQVNHVLPPFHARYVRLQPSTWSGRVCMRVELYGCESTGKDEVILPFILDPDTGFVNVSSKLNREQQQLFVMTVEVKDKGVPPQNSTTRLEISVTDTNDNRPEFTQDVYQASVPENAYGGYEVIRVRASDADVGSNAALKYKILEGGQGKFIIEAGSGIVRPSGLLNYEGMADKFYLLNISATDSGQPELSSTTLVNVSVTDFNDNEPVFNQSNYVVNVAEDVNVGNVVYDFTAMDADSGLNSEITYSIEGGDGTFSIGEKDGNLKLDQELDRESRSQFKMTVTASDNGVPKLSSKTEVLIRVTDVNDNPPVFTSPVYSRKMSEGVEVGTIVATVAAHDDDSGKNGDVRYEILDGNQEGHFSLDAVTGVITLSQLFDREKSETLTLTVEAKDLGIPELRDQALVKIFLTDVNDNAPRIQPKQMNAAVFENSEKGTFVFNVNATDADVQGNGQVQYFIMHGDENKFSINASSGIIETVGDLDRETKDLYTLIVMARDQGLVPFMDFGTVDVRVLDANDNNPLFSKTFGPFTLTENEPSGTIVGQVSAEDKDIDHNAVITYTITDGDPSNSFAINASTGVITSAELLDRETKTYHVLTVTATNLGSSPPLSSSTNVRVDILDTNDIVPEFSFPSYNRSISEASPPGTSVVKVSALDKDEGTNGRVLYNLLFGLSTPGSDVFGINTETGLVTLRVQIDEQEQRLFRLVVEAKDIGSPQALASTVPIYVTIDDVNDNQPYFEKKSYSVSTSEVTDVGTYIMRVQASDADTGTNAKITYKIISGDDNGNFRINASTGGLYIKTSLDREAQPHYKLEVAAYNLEEKAYNETGRPVQGRVDSEGYYFDTTEISVKITDVNDNAPLFIRPFFAGGISESAELNTFILKIVALDKDVGNFSAVVYRITSGNDGGFFAMDESTGIIRSASLFREKKGQWFEIMVTAFDNFGRAPNNEAKNAATVRIYVLLDEQRVTLQAEVDPSLIEENKEEFIRALENITESQVYIEAIFKVFSKDKDGREKVNSEVVFHAVKESTQTILTSDEVLSTISKNDAMLESLYAKWKIQYVKPTPTEPSTDDGLSNAELVLIIIGSLVALCLLLGLCFAIKTRCRGQKREMYSSPRLSRSVRGGQTQARMGSSWSYYDDVISTIENKSVAPVRVHSTHRADTFSMEERPGSAYSSEYLLSKKRLSPSGDDKLWNEGDHYMSQDSKLDSYLDDDGESDNAARSDVSHSSSGGNARMLAMMGTEELPVTKV